MAFVSLRTCSGLVKTLFQSSIWKAKLIGILDTAQIVKNRLVKARYSVARIPIIVQGDTDYTRGTIKKKAAVSVAESPYRSMLSVQGLILPKSLLPHRR